MSYRIVPGFVSCKIDSSRKCSSSGGSNSSSNNISSCSSRNSIFSYSIRVEKAQKAAESGEAVGIYFGILCISVFAIVG